MVRAAEMFKDYRKMKQELTVLEFKLRDFKGIPREDVIESMTYSGLQEERVQENKTSDKTCKTAIYYRKVAERLNEEYFDGLIKRYEYLKEKLDFFDFLVGSLDGKLPEFIRDMVIEKRNWEALMEKYSVSYSTVGRYRRKAEKELDRLYQFRDEMETEYMLS